MSNPKSSVDPSLWWDPFASLLSDLENTPLSSDLPPSLAKKLKENHEWFVDTVAHFKPPNPKSREALNSPQLKIGLRELTVEPQLKDKALHISSYLHLDEVQSYILIVRCLEHNDLSADSEVSEYLHVILLHYYIERQCLLKCTRQILLHALHVGIGTTEKNSVTDEALKLISNGLERKLISVLHDLLSSSHPEQMDVDLFTLWAEETLIEDSLVLNIIFLIYYESLCSCNGETWKELCSLYKGILSGSYNFGKLAISNEALKSFSEAKVQLQLILIETLDLENLLQLLHDDIPFRQGSSTFSSNDIQEMDALVSSFSAFETKEPGPLILAWAVCVCLISSLPGKEENNLLMEIDHVGYVRQAFEGATLSYCVEILESDMLKESDGPVAGYRSVLRTFISSFIACYEINLQLEDSTLNLILDILCKVYRGEESLCVQFWDKDSFIDGPIRCLLCNLEGEFPFRTMQLVRLLSSLCEGSWPAECVFNFLNKSTGISSLFEISSESLVDNISQIVETHVPLHVPGVESLVIPSKTRGHVLKVVGGNTALVRWEYAQSGLLVLLLRLAQENYLESNEEVFLTVDLLSRMVFFNAAVTVSLIHIGGSFYFQENGMNGHVEKNPWVVEIICFVIKKLSPNSRGAALMSMGVSILAKMLNRAPSQIAAVSLKADIFEMALKTSIFDVGYGGSSSGSWFISGKLVKMLLIDSEQNDCDNPLTISVLEFTLQLLKTGLENDLVLALVVFSLQYILVNHEYWKYKAKHIRWKVTLKVLEVMKACVMCVSFSDKLGVAIRDLLLSDSSIHNTLFRLTCTSKHTLENLYVSRHIELAEIEGFQHAIGSALDILYNMLSKFSKDISPSLPLFYHAVLSSTPKPVPVVVALASLISYHQDSAIQVGATKALSSLLIMVDCLQPYMSANVCFALDDKQITDLRHSIKHTLVEESEWNEDLFCAIVNLLTSSARYQPAFLVALSFSKEDFDVQLSNAVSMKQATNEASNGPSVPKKSCLINSLLHYVEKSNDFIGSNPGILLPILDFLKALWEGAGHYIAILECLKGSGEFWKHLSSCISLDNLLKAPPLENLTESRAQKLVYKYQCHTAILDIMAYDMFLTKKLLHAESLLKEAFVTKNIADNSGSTEKSKSANDNDLKNIFMNWSERSILHNLIQSYTSCDYKSEVSYRAKVAASLSVVHVMMKLATGKVGSLSVSLLEKIQSNFKNLRGQPGFSELLAQYSQRGYSDGKELEILVLNDLYYHLQGELEGRKIGSGPFKELSQYLVESNCLQTYRQKYDDKCLSNARDIFLYDLSRIRSDLGLSTWDYMDWKASKAIVEIMLNCMQEANSMVLLASSKLSALKTLITVLTLFEDNSEIKTTTWWKIPDQLCFSCIDNTCRSFHVMVESLSPTLDAHEEILDSLAAEAELLLHLMRSVQSSLPLSVCVAVLKTSCSCLKILRDFESSFTVVKKTVELLLMLVLLVVECSRTFDKESEHLVEVSNVCLGLLPILCNCIATAEYYALSLTIVDFILRNFLMPATWFPIIQKHLQLQNVILNLQDKNSLAFLPITLKFLLTLARVRGGAEMLLSAGFIFSLKVLFADLLEGWPSTVVTNNNGSIKSSEKIEKPQQIWGLGLAVITAMINSLGDSSALTEIMENVIPFLFSEKAHLILYYLDAPEYPSENHSKKRPRAQKTQTSLIALKETEHTLVLMCTLAKHWKSWVKAMKEMDSQLREKSIHLLAFISRGIHRLGESPGRTAPLLCPPISKEEFESSRRPSFVKSKNGWFALSPLCCSSKPKFSPGSTTSTALVIKSQPGEISNSVSPTFFSDLVAMQIYRIAFLILKFLCLEAEGVAKRSEEVGFVDLAHIPELPMPEILHALQDQAISVVSELCHANKLDHIDPEIQSVCLLMLQIMEMALYLEFCVLQICGIRPVLGRVEDFSKEVKSLLKAVEGHDFLKTSTKSLKQVISLVYPGLLQTEGFL